MKNSLSIKVCYYTLSWGGKIHNVIILWKSIGMQALPSWSEKKHLVLFCRIRPIRHQFQKSPSFHHLSEHMAAPAEANLSKMKIQLRFNFFSQCPSTHQVRWGGRWIIIRRVVQKEGGADVLSYSGASADENWVLKKWWRKNHSLSQLTQPSGVALSLPLFPSMSLATHPPPTQPPHLSAPTPLWRQKEKDQSAN